MAAGARPSLALALAALAGILGARMTRVTPRHVLAAHALVDAHTDLPLGLREKLGGVPTRFHVNQSGSTHLDAPRLRKGMAAAVVAAAYVECGENSGEDALAQLRLIREVADVDNDVTVVATSAREVRLAHATRRTALILGVEGLHAFEDGSGMPLAHALRAAYRLGARVVTLNHNCHTAVSDSCCDPAGSDDAGLRKRDTIHLLNDMGMVVDLSHASPRTARDVLLTSRAPVIVSHSGSYELCAHPRNFPSDLLPLLRDNGGLVMVPFHIPFVCSDNVEGVVDHIEFFVRSIGARHVGIGSDFDGIPKGVHPLSGADAYPALVAALLRRLPASDVALIIGSNFLRVMEEAASQQRVGSLA